MYSPFFGARSKPSKVQRFRQILEKRNKPQKLLDITRERIRSKKDCDEITKFLKEKRKIEDARMSSLKINKKVQGYCIEQLFRVLPLTNIKNFDFSANSITSDEAKLLAKAIPRSKLTSLSLMEMDIPSRGLTQIIKVLPRSQLNELFLSNLEKRGSAVKKLIPLLNQTQLTHLTLMNCPLSSKVWEASVDVLSKNQTLQSLDLSGDLLHPKKLTDKKFMSILKKVLEVSPSLLALNINNRKMGNKLMLDFIHHLPQYTLKRLEIGGNKLSKKGLQEFLDILPQTAIEILYLGDRGEYYGRKESFQLKPIKNKNGKTILVQYFD